MGWSATDDVLLKDSLQTLGTLEAVARQVRFSVRVTPEQLEERWRRILFDENVAREAAVQMSSAAAQGLAKRVMWSAREEEVLRGIGPTGYTAFLALLEQPGQREIFHSSRTPKSLEAHYYRMKRYGSLQAAGEAAGDERERREMSDAEEEIAVEIRAGPPPPAPSEERARDLRALERRQGAEVLALERELELAGLGPGEGNALAVLRGRRMRVALRTKEALLGRTTRESRPDVNLLEEELPPGAQARISRRAALLRLKRDLRFHLTNLSRRPLFVNGRPLAPTRRRILPDQALIEVRVYCIYKSPAQAFSATCGMRVRADAARLDLAEAG